MAPTFGLNKGVYGMLPSDAYRGYNGPTAGFNGVPQSWPGPGASPVPQTARYPFVSIKPNISMTIAGELDKELQAFFQTMPPGVILDVWPEGEAKRFGIAPADLVAVNRHVHELLYQFRGDVRFMQCFTGYSARHGDISPFIFDNADMYGIDGYPSAATDTPEDVFDAAFEELVTFGEGHIGILETNSTGAHGTLPDNPEWYARVWKYAVERDFVCMLAFGSGTVPLSAADIQVLKDIQHLSVTQSLF